MPLPTAAAFSSPPANTPDLPALLSARLLLRPASESPSSAQMATPTASSSSSDAPQRIHFQGRRMKISVTVANWRSCKGMPNLMNWAVV